MINPRGETDNVEKGASPHKRSGWKVRSHTMAAGETGWKCSPGEPKTPFEMASWMKRSRSSRTLLALLLWLPWLLLPGRCWAYPCNEKYRKFSLRHTMCLPPRPDCRIYSSGVSRKEIKEILAAHNSYRRQVANGKIRRLAPAANMLELVWDPELATVAQAHANQCRFHHDCHPCRRVSRFTTGQNLFMHYSSSLKQQPTNWTNVAKSWFDEYKIFDVSEVDSLQTVEDSGHFSQMIWAETSHVGCGKARFKIRGEDWYKTLYTCNYGPVGNVITSKIYEKGRPCSRCPNNTVCSASNPGLCGVRGRTVIQQKRPPPYIRQQRIGTGGFLLYGKYGHNDGYMSGYRFPQPHQQGGVQHPSFRLYKFGVPMKQGFEPMMAEPAILQTPQQTMQPQQAAQPYPLQAFEEPVPEWQQESGGSDQLSWPDYDFETKRSQREPRRENVHHPLKIKYHSKDRSKNSPCGCDADAIKRMQERVLGLLSNIKGVNPAIEIKCKCGNSLDTSRATWS